jgi:uncharacterized protein
MEDSAVPRKRPDANHADRREFLKTAGVVAAGALVGEQLGYPAEAAPALQSITAPKRFVQPFRLNQVTLGEGLFREKRDRMLLYARNYGSDSDFFIGPDRMLSNFRANAGLDTKGAQPPGSWDNATGYLRGHYSGHFMSLLAQAYAGSGEEIYKRKLDYMVAALGQCQDALADAARRPTPRSAGRFGNALRLTGSPLGSAEHVSLPSGIVRNLSDFTIAAWIQPWVYERRDLSDSNPNTDPAVHHNSSVLFDFGNPSEEFGAPPQSHMYLTVRVSNSSPVPRFAITTKGTEAEQRIDGTAALPNGQWTHIAVTLSGNTGTLYINGTSAGVNTNMTLRPADLGVTTGNWIGRRQFPQLNVSYLNAAIDEFQIYDRALSVTQVQSLMDSPGGSTGGGNVAWYRFDEAAGKDAVDSSGRGNHGTIIAPTDGRRHPGFLSAYPETPFIRLEEFATYGGNQGIWAPYYTLHKIVAGLLDAHVLAGNTQALDIASKIGDWVYSRLARQEQLNRMWNTYIAGEYGGINESLAQLHALRPEKPEYTAAAKRFHNTVVYDATVSDNDILDGRHANQHVPQFTGYLRIFEQTGESGYLTAARNFWNMVVPHRTYSHGGMGVGEIFRKRGVIAGSLYQSPNDSNAAETCPLYNMLKLSRNLFFHEPDPRYMNYYEQGLFNQIAGSRRDVDSAANPLVTYFVPVRPGQRRNYGNTGTCCGGTGMENHTKYQDSIYFRAADDSALFVNLYVDSTLNWQEKKFTVNQSTKFPAEGKSRLTVNGSGTLEIRLRVPVWAGRGFAVRLNGTAQNLTARPGTYVALPREWRTGDTIDVEIPLRFRIERTLDNPQVQSIFYGPTLMAVQNDPVGNSLESGLLNFTLYKHVKLDGNLGPALTPAGKPMHFMCNGYTLAPFFVADPDPSAAVAYHVYVRRHEPTIVFGSKDSGAPNSPRDDGFTLLDRVWSEAPFASHAQFLAVVNRIAEEWRNRGLLSPNQQQAVTEAARQARSDLEV